MRKLILERGLTLASSVANASCMHTSYTYIIEHILVRGLTHAENVGSPLLKQEV